jgi:hypothetical protein
VNPNDLLGTKVKATKMYNSGFAKGNPEVVGVLIRFIDGHGSGYAIYDRNHKKPVKVREDSIVSFTE